MEVTSDSLFIDMFSGMARNMATIMLKSLAEKEALRREDHETIDNLRWEREKQEENEAVFMGQIEKLEAKVKALEEELAKSREDLLYWYREATTLKQKLEEIKDQLIFLWGRYAAGGLLLASMILRKKYLVSWNP